MYSWQVDYIAALLETDDSKLAWRLYEAMLPSNNGSSARLSRGAWKIKQSSRLRKLIAVIRAEKLNLDPPSVPV